MDSTVRMAVIEMELAAMWAKLQSMKQTMADGRDTFDQLDHISDDIDKLRRQLGMKIETAR